MSQYDSQVANFLRGSQLEPAVFRDTYSFEEDGH